VRDRNADSGVLLRPSAQLLQHRQVKRHAVVFHCGGGPILGPVSIIGARMALAAKYQGKY
jgi:hypothetical protein